MTMYAAYANHGLLYNARMEPGYSRQQGQTAGSLTWRMELQAQRHYQADHRLPQGAIRHGSGWIDGVKPQMANSYMGMHRASGW